MNMPVMDGHDDEKNKSHPENPTRCKPCDEGEHDSCRIKYAGQKKCACECRGPLRTKRHDWLDSHFDDEIDLERSIAETPPKQLVTNAMMKGAAMPNAMDVAWYYLGKFEPTDKRPSTSDAKWRLSCRRCLDGKTRIDTVRVVLEERAQQTVDWLHERKVLTDARPERVYRVGRCKKCQTMFWFEMLVKK